MANINPATHPGPLASYQEQCRAIYEDREKGMSPASAESSSSPHGSQSASHDLSPEMNGKSDRIPQKYILDELTKDMSLVLSPSVVTEVKDSFEEEWRASEDYAHRYEFLLFWSPRNHIRLDFKMLQLMSISDPHKRSRKLPYINTWEERNFYNKATIFYWTQSAIEEMLNSDGLRGSVILGGIWNSWAEALSREPHMALDEFFAAPVSVKKEHAVTIHGMMRVHEQICAQVRKNLDEKPWENWWPKPKWPNPRYFKLYPLCEAIIAIFDEYIPVKAEKHEDGYYHYDDVTEVQTVILVRTGYEEGLSAPVSFEELNAESLPLKGKGLSSDHAIRIPLQVGVRFVANLLLREEAAYPEANVAGPYLSNEPDHPFREWETEGHNYADKQLAKYYARGHHFEPFAVKKALGLLDSDDYLADHSRPMPFRLGWV